MYCVQTSNISDFNLTKPDTKNDLVSQLSIPLATRESEENVRKLLPHGVNNADFV